MRQAHTYNLRRRRQRGVALMMSLVTLFLLISVAVPYVLTTSYQEKSALAYSDRVEARMGARSAADHAMAKMGYSNRLLQFRRWAHALESQDPTGVVTNYEIENDPFVDNYFEFDSDVPSEIEANFGTIVDEKTIGLRPNELSSSYPEFRADDERRQVWSAYVSDEQGKVNLNTAPPHLIGNLLGSGIIEEVDGTLSNCTVTMSEGAENFSDGPGHFVVHGTLCRYDRKVGNSFYEVQFGAPHRFDYEGAPPDTTRREVFNEIVYAAPLYVNALAIPLVAHLIPFQRLLGADGDIEPWDYSHVDQMRSVAELGLFPPGEQSYDDAFDPSLWLTSRNFFTVYSTGPFKGGYYDPRLASSLTHFRDDEGLHRDVVTFRNPEVLNKDWLTQDDPRKRPFNTRQLPVGLNVRLRYPDGHFTYGMTLGANQIASPPRNPNFSGENYTVLKEDLPVLEIQEITPININTAPWEVLVANVKGLRAGNSIIGQSQAESFAAAILHVIEDENEMPDPEFTELDELLEPSDSIELQPSRPLRWGVIRSNNDLNLILTFLVNNDLIDRSMATAIMNQQTAPFMNRYTVTAPFCFKSYNIVTIDAMARTFAGIGTDRASARFKEVVALGSDDPRQWEWRDLSVLKEEESRPQHNHFFTNFSQTSGLRLLSQTQMPPLLDPQAIYAKGRKSVVINNNTMMEPLKLDSAKAFYRQGSVRTVDIISGVTTSGGTEVADMYGGNMEFWYRVPQGFISNDNRYIFDCGERQYSNRISLLWWGGGRREWRLQRERPGLTLRVKDRTLEQAFTAVHLDVDPARFRDNNWYHFNIGWGRDDVNLAGVNIGSNVDNNLSRYSLVVDGIAERGTTQVRTDHVFRNAAGAWEARTSSLTMDVPPELGNLALGGLTSDVLTIQPIDIGAFPNSGVIRVGHEVIAYGQKTGNGFTQLTRGARGTRAPAQGEPAYRQGTRVSVFGYAVGVRSHSTTPYLPAGGANLADALDGNGVYSVIGGNGNPDDSYYAPEVIGPNIGLTKNGTLQLDTTVGLPQVGVLYVSGLCWKEYAKDPNGTKLFPDHNGDGIPEMTTANPTLSSANYYDAEYIVFQRAGQSISIIERYDRNFNIKSTDDYYQFMGAWGGTVPLDPVTISSNSKVAGSIAILVSVAGDKAGTYHDPQTLGAGFSRIQIDYEWIQYHRLHNAAGTNMFLYTNSTALDGAASSATTRIAGGNVPFGVSGFRELKNGNAQFHASGKAIVPTFCIRGIQAGAGDLITILESPNQHKQQHSVRRRMNIINQNGIRMQIVSLSDNTLRDYRANESEVLKFPTDELPRGIPTTIRFGGTYLGGNKGATLTGGEIDELKFSRTSSAVTGRVLDDIIGRTGGTILMDSAAQPPGIVKIQDELIVYRDIRPMQATIWTRPTAYGPWVQSVVNCVELVDVTRGALGTRVDLHGRDTQALSMTWHHVSYPGATVGANTNRVDLISNQISPLPYGFMRAENPGTGTATSAVEILGYTRTTSTGTPRGVRLISGDYRPLDRTALFRGAYGTAAQGWDESTVFTQMPVRQPDLFPYWMRPIDVAPSPSPEVAYLQGSETFPNAKLSRIRWRMDPLPTDKVGSFLKARLLLRFDNQPDWSTPPDDNGPLYAYDFDFERSDDIQDGSFKTKEMTIDVGDIAPERIDTLQWRLYYYFLPGAYQQDYWKGTLTFRGLIAEMDCETRVLNHEELR